MTAQFPETLLIDGEEVPMFFNPPLPEAHPRIVEVDDESAAESFTYAFSTACWRNYVGTWEIKDQRLFLTDLKGKFKLSSGEPLLADWFSGVLRVPKGEMLQYIHMGYGSVYEEELHIVIENGAVVKSNTLDNRGGTFDARDLTNRNMPGGENRFPGDTNI